jgi:hypothetical protein
LTTAWQVFRFVPDPRTQPNAYRECASWYEEEFRPSGTVVVPKMRCWWVNP